ncbi:hypothetical protein CBM2605_B130174 [Cupriavidus neocaledonicus]|uniref:HTH lysR-type domain-containing protein n=1 Tax=Cupriavidus neocaledonicus TaxID=1040979 RepID=A0ABY1VB93_9BURK|nr:hypothetical protein CBM2605_B130174 [Cupriavidus neocaledonicus]
MSNPQPYGRLAGMDKLPPLNALRAFEAAARHLSITTAAQELHVTPGAVSRQIRTLEEGLGVQLLHRGHRQISLTRTGEDYYRAVTRGHGRPARGHAAARQARPAQAAQGARLHHLRHALADTAAVELPCGPSRHRGAADRVAGPGRFPQGRHRRRDPTRRRQVERREYLPAGVQHPGAGLQPRRGGRQPEGEKACRPAAPDAAAFDCAPGRLGALAEGGARRRAGRRAQWHDVPEFRHGLCGGSGRAGFRHRPALPGRGRPGGRAAGRAVPPERRHGRLHLLPADAGGPQ